MIKDDRLIFLLAQARNCLMTSLDRTLLAQAGITAPQAGALFYLLKNEGCLLSQLSQGLILDNSAITGMVDRLEKRNLIQRKNCPDDRRAIKIFLTDAGREVAHKSLPVVKEYNQAIKEGFSSEEINAFKSVLQAIIEHFPGSQRQVDRRMNS